MAQTADRRVRIGAENIGGIDDTEVELRPGVTLLTGRNASNRTSLLQAIMAALGSDQASLKADADEGRVEMEVGGERYTRTVTRTDDGVVFGGDPYTEDPELADLFAFLLESNDARRAGARGDDLREIIMRPVDTDAVRAEIRELEARKRDIEAELQQRERLDEELISLEEERAALERRIADKQDALEAKRAEIDAADAELEGSQDRKAELESRLAELRERRSLLDDVRDRLETERKTVAELRDELADVEAELEEDPETPAGEVETIEGRIDELRERKRTLDSGINQLQALIQFNEEILDGDGVSGLVGPEAESGSADDVTGRLLPESESFVCWTCGTEATRSDIAAMLDDVRDRRQTLVEERKEVATELDDLKDRKERLVEHRRRRDELERRREDLGAEIREAESEIESLAERKEELVAEIGRLEEAVETLREERYDEIVELHREANELQLEREQLESELERTEEALASTRDRLDELETLAQEKSDVQAQLQEARTRIDRLEEKAIEAFNDGMDTVLDVLDYANLERIWIERTEREVREGRRTVTHRTFDLHVVRRTDGGAGYEDTVDHLSESEREVTGLVFALAGYLTHDVHETMPFMLLDSIEAIDAERIATLVEYLSDHAEHLVVALLPEDAQAVDDRYPAITEI